MPQAVKADEFAEVPKQRTVLRFRNTDAVMFRFTNDGLDVDIETERLPAHHGELFNPAFLDYLHQFRLDDPLTLHLLEDAVARAQYSGVALRALLDTMESTKGGDPTPRA